MQMNQKYRHMVIFCLKYELNSIEAENFLGDGHDLLTQIPGVEDFKVFNQISLKNDYDYGFSMEFSSQEAYQFYN